MEETTTVPGETFEPDMPEEMASRATGLRPGWSTGTCASAAAKAAVYLLVHRFGEESVDVTIPNGRRVIFEVEYPRGFDLDPATAVVVKDAGDDPDCTHGARITASARWAERDSSGITLTGGWGVGKVTKAGLGLPVGSPAINPVPRRMIEKAVSGVTNRPVTIEFSVPGGEEMALKTTNARLGIVGGISILGTNGVVRPFSTAAYRASVVQQVDVASAQGEDTIVLATGHRSEALAMRELQHLDDVCFVEVGDFTGIALRRCVKRSIARVYFVGMAGKIAKLAKGVMMTHFHRSEVDVEFLAEIAGSVGAPPHLIAAARETSTARHFFEACVASGHLAPLELLCSMASQSCVAHAGDRLPVSVWMSDYDGSTVVARA